MKLAVCQFAADADVAANTDRCVTAIRDAAASGADLAVLPEVAMYFDPRHDRSPGPHGQALDGPFAQAIAQGAAAAGIAVVVGMLERVGGGENGDGRSEGDDDGGRDYNTVLALNASGQRLGTYRKIHLYDAFGFRESDIYLPGPIDRPVTFDINGVTVGVLTCYDLRFPEPFRWLVDAGAQVVALPAAWIAGPAKEHHWQTLLAARAIENTVYLAGADQSGPVSCGQSRIVDPMGTVLAGVGERPGVAVAEIDPSRIDAVRVSNPSLANRRFDVAPRP